MKFDVNQTSVFSPARHQGNGGPATSLPESSLLEERRPPRAVHQPIAHNLRPGILKHLFKRWIAQLNSVGVQHHNGHRAVVDESVEISSPLFDSYFEIVVRFLYSDIPLFDSVEHAVELVEQNADFVLASFDRPNGIVFMRGDRRRRLCQFANRSEITRCNR